MEISNQINFVIQFYGDNFCPTEYWHGSYTPKYLKYSEWKNNIEEKLTRNYLKNNCKTYYKTLTKIKKLEEEDVDDQIMEDLYTILENKSKDIKNILIDLFPILNTTAEGSSFDIIQIIIDKIINPLLLKEKMYDDFNLNGEY